MKSFDVYSHPVFGYQAVKAGFSWPGLFLCPIWMLFKRLWLIGAVAAIAYGLCLLIAAALEGAPAEVKADKGWILYLADSFRVVLHVVTGINGNNWVRSNLKRLGYELHSTISASSPEAAIGLAAKASTD